MIKNHDVSTARTFIHLKMTSERSKHRDFLSLIFISKQLLHVFISDNIIRFGE